MLTGYSSRDVTAAGNMAQISSVSLQWEWRAVCERPHQQDAPHHWLPRPLATPPSRDTSSWSPTTLINTTWGETQPGTGQTTTTNTSVCCVLCHCYHPDQPLQPVTSWVTNTGESKLSYSYQEEERLSFDQNIFDMKRQRCELWVVRCDWSCDEMSSEYSSWEVSQAQIPSSRF